MLGKPTVKGTRITVESILEKLAAGRTYEEVLEAYPRLSQRDIYDALAFATKSLSAAQLCIKPSLSSASASASSFSSNNGDFG